MNAQLRDQLTSTSQAKASIATKLKELEAKHSASTTAQVRFVDGNVWSTYVSRTNVISMSPQIMHESVFCLAELHYSKEVPVVPKFEKRIDGKVTRITATQRINFIKTHIP